MPNETPFGVLCQRHPSIITVLIISLHFLVQGSKSDTSTSIDLVIIPTLILEKYTTSITVGCAEQMYMFCRALYFVDDLVRTRILATPDPKE